MKLGVETWRTPKEMKPRMMTAKPFMRTETGGEEHERAEEED